MLCRGAEGEGRVPKRFCCRVDGKVRLGRGELLLLCCLALADAFTEMLLWKVKDCHNEER